MDKIDTTTIGDAKTLEIAIAVNGLIDHLGIAPVPPAAPAAPADAQPAV